MNLLTAIVWFRQDLRVEDNPALMAAVAGGKALIPLFIWSPEEEGKWSPGGASRWWLHHSLLALNESLKEYGLSLIVRKGNTFDVLQDVIRSSQATAVYWNRRYEPFVIKRDASIKTKLKSEGIIVESFKANVLFEPHEIFNKEKKPFRVFTPFWKTCLSKIENIESPLAFPQKKIKPAIKIDSESLDSLGLLPKIHWDSGLQAQWKPGEKQAKAVLSQFIHQTIQDYQESRDRPDVDGVSQISPYLHFGEISPKMILSRLQKTFQDPIRSLGSECYWRQIGWREFGYHLLYHFPQTPDQPLRKEFSAFPWQANHTWLRAWQRGLTGYPIVDAGMRALWKTGWMHNRVRMVVGSFLVKDLLIPWQEGAKWFWDTLVDADLANNTLGWQWVAGCGADAAPFFRIFNPITQGEKFDPQGHYVRQWIPELARMPDKWIHAPWEAPVEVLERADVTLGKDYPKPIVNHDEARKAALAAFQELKGFHE